MRKLIIIIIVLFSFQITGKAQTASAETGQTEVEKLSEDNKWYRKGFSRYNPNKSIVNELENKLSPYSFIVFGGTWCPDTRNLLPKFYKTIEEAGVPKDNTKLYLLNYYKKSKGGIEERYNITSVPTFVVLKRGKEVGRIEGHVNRSIEKDLLKIIE